MTTIYDKERAQNVTLVEVPDNIVSLVRTEEKDGYSAVQLKLTDDKGKEVLREFPVSEKIDLKVGDKITLEQFQKGDKVIVKAVSKGKGYQGVVKRHGFGGAPASHGHRHDLRAPGSIGSAFPERVMKGKKMAGRMGGQNVTVKDLLVVTVDKDRKIIALRGAVPGNNKGLVKIIGNLS